MLQFILRLLGALWRFRLVKWTIRLALFLFLLDQSLFYLHTFGVIDLDNLLGIEDEVPYDANRAGTNPYRDLPADPAVLDTIKEVAYISDILSATFLPTSLPDDDYALCSHYLRSLETRTDISWLVLEETGIDRTISAISSRGRSWRNPIPDEPFSLHERFTKLHQHWWALQLDPGKPERWEKWFDETYLPPLLKSKPLENAQDSQPFQIQFTPDQQAEADAKFAKYLRERERKVSYLKIHPPKPLGFVPVSRDSGASQRAWGSLFSDGVVEAGRSISFGSLTENPTFKPIYGSLGLELVPFSWVSPADKDKPPQSDEDRERQTSQILVDMEKMRERRARREEFQKWLIEENERKKKEKTNSDRGSLKAEL
ncbi:hypothetical protein NECHADRAFT_52057 [Paecilomyces variotii No. 5]|uniref:Uncharacterized protein n=1 Tax=Byssochlamys spectabilis (strain No. 5 / NBRC 109023) TaxID=1356009 RepID=V5G3E9_BYSSN|nr:hypothetical protein NECHADRAFT_52057 [Paecilomyces variotii No. 5]